MRVPKYEPQVGVPTPPDARRVAAPNEEAFGAGIGDALQKAGAKLASIAARQQEEADRAEFMLMSAQADAFAEETYANEANNPDYEGTINRFQETFRKYGEGYMQRVPDRLKQKAEQLLEMKRLSYEGKFKGLFLAKQSDAIKSGYMKIYDTLVKGNNKEELAKAVSTFSKYSAQERERLIQTGYDQIDKQVKDLQYDELVGIFTKNPWAKVDKGKYPLFDNRDWDKIDRFRRGEITQRRVEANLAKAQRKEWVGNQVDELYGNAKTPQEFRAGLLKFASSGDISNSQFDNLMNAFNAKQGNIFIDSVFNTKIEEGAGKIRELGKSLGVSEEMLIKGEDLFSSLQMRKFKNVAELVGPEGNIRKTLSYWGASPSQIDTIEEFARDAFSAEISENYNTNLRTITEGIQSGLYNGDLAKLYNDIGRFGLSKEDTSTVIKDFKSLNDPAKREDIGEIRSRIGDMQKMVEKGILGTRKNPDQSSLLRAQEAGSAFYRQAMRRLETFGGKGKTEDIIREIQSLLVDTVVNEKKASTLLGIPMPGTGYTHTLKNYEIDILKEQGWRVDRITGKLVFDDGFRKHVWTGSEEDWNRQK